MSVFEIKHARKSFGDLEVLKDISVSVEQGEVVAILGPSGSGKSTFLRCATMLEELDGGSLCYGSRFAAKDENGRSVYVSRKERHKLYAQFGLVFQNFNLFPHYSVMENIINPLMVVQHMKKPEALERGMALLEKMGLSDKGDYYPCQLSGGQQQRVSIARALAMNSNILFFDEPTSALDPISTMKIEDLALELKKDYTIVIVTHNMQQAARISDKTAFFLLGELIEFNETKQLFANPSNPKTEEYITGRFG